MNNMNEKRVIRKLENALKMQGDKFSVVGSLVTTPVNVNRGLFFGLPNAQAQLMVDVLVSNINLVKRTWEIDIIYTYEGNKTEVVQMDHHGTRKDLIKMVDGVCMSTLAIRKEQQEHQGDEDAPYILGYYWNARIKKYVGSHKNEISYLTNEAKGLKLFDSKTCNLAYKAKREKELAAITGEEHFI